MGKFESFEEALLSLGDKWAAFGEELKTSFNSMVTSSREATHDGRRRALDRANQAMIAGGKRRIEAYALSLSNPSMMIFGLGILLPLMVGSFLPMLSWDLWSMDGVSGGPAVESKPQSTSQMIFIMNLLFPAIALLIALSAVSNHPLNSAPEDRTDKVRRLGGILGTLVASCALVVLEWQLLEDSGYKPVIVLFSGVAPVSLWLLVRCGKTRDNQENLAEDIEDVLFRTGARMLEGENFESSFHRVANDPRKGLDRIRRTSLRWVLGGSEPVNHPFWMRSTSGMQNAMHGIRITREAAAKDETAAGMLAMDLASYLKDLRELESSLRNKLKPTVSMMKTTALLLAPIVLGVTYAIYLSLASMLGSPGQPSDAGFFFIVLGVFLAEIDSVVVYFVWGIEGKTGHGGFFQGLLAELWNGPGKPKTDGAGVLIRLGAGAIGTIAEHLGGRVQLQVDLQTDDCLVCHSSFAPFPNSLTEASGGRQTKARDRSSGGLRVEDLNQGFRFL